MPSTRALEFESNIVKGINEHTVRFVDKNCQGFYPLEDITGNYTAGILNPFASKIFILKSIYLFILLNSITF